MRKFGQVKVGFNLPKIKKGYGVEVCQVELDQLTRNLACLKKAGDNLQFKNINGTKVLNIGSLITRHCQKESLSKAETGQFEIHAYFASKHYGKSSTTSKGKICLLKSYFIKKISEQEMSMHFHHTKYEMFSVKRKLHMDHSAYAGKLLTYSGMPFYTSM